MDAEDFQLWEDSSALDLVADFHVAFGHPISNEIIDSNILATELAEHRLEFIEEEVEELRDALYSRDPVAFVDALQDLKYFIYGTELALGIPSEESFNAVHDANMDKLFPDGRPRYREGDRKVLKPADWVGPEERLAQILDQARERGSPFPHAA